MRLDLLIIGLSIDAVWITVLWVNSENWVAGVVTGGCLASSLLMGAARKVSR